MTEPDSPIAPQRAKQADLLPELSVVVPVHNEAGNIENLLTEIESALTGCCEFEIVYVDDGSDDGSAAELAGLRSGHARLRVLRHRNRSGQSAALWTGIAGARAAWIATMDGVGQNDPADIPALLNARDAGAIDRLWMVAGVRRRRRDSTVKRLSSRIANAPSGAGCCATPPPVPAAASSCFGAMPIWPCHFSITCTGSYRL